MLNRWDQVRSAAARTKTACRRTRMCSFRAARRKTALAANDEATYRATGVRACHELSGWGGSHLATDEQCVYCSESSELTPNHRVAGAS